MRLGWALISLGLVLLLQAPLTPAAAPTIDIGRPTWDTGWFQAEVYRELLQQLGYRVNEPQTLENETFYRQAAQGKSGPLGQRLVSAPRPLPEPGRH
jgi:ABC-type proline/glycine betaine transport system substrate-binding protein